LVIDENSEGGSNWRWVLRLGFYDNVAAGRVATKWSVRVRAARGAAYNISANSQIISTQAHRIAEIFMMAVKPIPDRLTSITPYLSLQNCGEAMAFYVRAFGAVEMYRMATPDGKVMHAEMRVGNAVIMLSDEFAQGPVSSPSTLGGSTVTLQYSVENADAAWQRASDAGCSVIRPLANMFWGDRMGVLKDPYGHVWAISQHVEDVSPEEMGKRAAEAMKSFC
jgi:PhnB protein